MANNFYSNVLVLFQCCSHIYWCCSHIYVRAAATYIGAAATYIGAAATYIGAAATYIGAAATYIGAAATYMFLQKIIPLRGSILQVETCQIFSLAENPRWSRVWQLELNQT